MRRSTRYPIPPELGHLLALRRIRRGHVVLVGIVLVIDHGRRTSDYIHDAVHELLDDGYLQLGEERADCGQRPVLITPSGEQLHAKLEELYR